MIACKKVKAMKPHFSRFFRRGKQPAESPLAPIVQRGYKRMRIMHARMIHERE